MRVPHALLTLPPSLLLLLATQLRAQQLADPRSERDGRRHPQQPLPTAVRKMPPDEGEKFMPEYYAFAPPDFPNGAGQAPLQQLVAARDAYEPMLTPEEEALLATNVSATLVFRPPFPRHLDPRSTKDGQPVDQGQDQDQDQDRKRSHHDKRDPRSLYRRTVDVLARLRNQRRDFTCPAGTHVCSNIGEPNYCCTDGTTCFVVENAPDAGNVGCCPDGQTCGGSVAACADGNTACPAEDGGGCCIPGFVCADIGCVQSTTSTLSSTTTPAPTSTSSPGTTSTSSPQPTSTSTPTPSTSTATSTPSSSGTGTGLPPVRPTSSGPDTSTITSSDGAYCPTGFYACLATAGSGCCRTGRDCMTTSCPPIASTTIITHGVTIVVPLTDAEQQGASAAASATCADGWFLCGTGPSQGAVQGCCPTGYACGTASCTLSTPTATATVQKELPGNEAAGRRAPRLTMLRDGGGGMVLPFLVWVGWGWVL